MLDSKYWDDAVDWLKPGAERQQILALIRSALTGVLEQHGVRSLLDVGCGFGIYFDIYHKLGLKVKGIDFSEKRVADAVKTVKQRSFGNIEVSRGDFLSEPLGEPYDCILLSYVLQHLEPSRVEELLHKIRETAKYYVVVGYYSEPFNQLLSRYMALCERFQVTPFTFDSSKRFNTIPYNYPELLNMEYDLFQFPGDNALLFFRGEKK